MNWQRRLVEIGIGLGGALALPGCIFVCNANPDPCCSAPESPACIDKRRGDLATPLDQSVGEDLAIEHRPDASSDGGGDSGSDGGRGG